MEPTYRITPIEGRDGIAGYAIHCTDSEGASSLISRGHATEKDAQAKIDRIISGEGRGERR